MRLRQNRFLNFLSPWVLTAIFSLFYILIILGGKNWDPMYFVNIGGKFDPRVQNEALGYDGQFAYQIADQPLHAQPYLDSPAYRYQRILYPILARLLSFGQSSILPWMLILINFGAIVFGTKITEMLMVENHQNKWYAISYGLFIGLQISLRLDLTEPLAFLFVQIAGLFLLRRVYWLASLFYIFATLTRELTLTFVLAATLMFFFNRRYKFAILWGFVTVLPFIIWQIVLRSWLGNWGIQSGGAFATAFEILPFRGLWSLVGKIPLPLFILMALVVSSIVLIPAAVSIYVSARSFFKRNYNFGTFSLLINSLLFPFLPQSNMMALSGLVRVAVGLLVGVLDYGAQNNSKKALNYSLLWVLALVFLYQDNFVGNIN